MNDNTSSKQPTPEERIARNRARREAQNKQETQGPPAPTLPPAALDSFNESLREMLTWASYGFSALSRIIFLAAAAVLITSGIPEVGAQSKGSASWELEDSFVALQLRALGYTKIGIGLMSLAFSIKAP